MSDFSQLVPEYVRNLSGYTPGKSLRQAQQESHVNCIKMASNENPFGPSPMAVKAMQSGEVLVAPGTSCRRQVQDLAGALAVHPATLIRSLLDENVSD